MRRFVPFTAMALVMAVSAGCHLCHKKHVAAAYYAECCDPCAGGASVVTPINSIAGPPVVSKVLPSGVGSPQFP
jgi:hypothetical protein